MEEAKTRSIIIDATYRALLRHTKAIFYPGRSWVSVFEAATKMEIPQAEILALENFVHSCHGAIYSEELTPQIPRINRK